jgi:hypothetical protein
MAGCMIYAHSIRALSTKCLHLQDFYKGFKPAVCHDLVSSVVGVNAITRHGRSVKPGPAIHNRHRAFCCRYVKAPRYNGFVKIYNPLATVRAVGRLHRNDLRNLPTIRICRSFLRTPLWVTRSRALPEFSWCFYSLAFAILVYRRIQESVSDLGCSRCRLCRGAS